MKTLLSHGRTLITEFRLAMMKQWVAHLEPGSLVSFRDFRINITHGLDYYMQYKDLFVRRIYDFRSSSAKPRIIDGGSNIGMSILYFKTIYPEASITAFEPDPILFTILKENLERNGINDVSIIPAGLGAKRATLPFSQDNRAGGRVQMKGEGAIEVRIDTLSDYLNEETDFLKLNIEGQEFPVLTEIAQTNKLRLVKELVLEYHGWPTEDQALHSILNLLDTHGYRYLVHDFDAETCGSSKPPFNTENGKPWFCLVYAKRQELHDRHATEQEKDVSEKDN